MNCKICGTSEPTLFRPGNRSRCRKCVDRRSVEQARERRKADPDKYARLQKIQTQQKNPLNQKHWQLRSLYRIGIDDYFSILDAQNSVCPICLRLFEDGKIDGKYGQVDHDHACCPDKKSCGHCIRGILCDRCNKGLGFFRDDGTALLRAVIYIEKGCYTSDSTSL